MKYDCIVIGSGAGGLTVAFGLSGAGKKVLLIERSNPGGECTWSGCVPSKAFINYSKENISGEEALENVRDIILKVAGEENEEAFEKKGIKFIKGVGKFVDSDKVQVNGEIYHGKNIVIATGSSPFIPPIPGLDSIDFLTNSNFFKQKTLPKKIAMIGGGVISLELSFALKRFGTEVSIYEIGDRLVPMEDKEISDFYIKKLEDEGIELFLSCGNIEVEKIDEKVKIKSASLEKIYDKIFLSTGRVPNLDQLDLEKGNIEHSKKGIDVFENLLTTNKKVYAIGDVVGPYRFSHIAGYNGEIAVRNILFPFIKKKVDYKSVPWTIFTNPEFSRMGLNEKEAREAYEKVYVYTLKGEKNERSIIALEKDFYLKVICDNKFRVIGGYCIGDRAGEIIGVLQLMHKEKIKFYKLMNSIQAYPTYTDSLRKMSKIAYVDFLQSILKF